MVAGLIARNNSACLASRISRVLQSDDLESYRAKIRCGGVAKDSTFASSGSDPHDHVPLE